MVLFAILLIMLIILALLLVFVVGAAGATGIVLFGDVIVCMVFIVLIMRAIIKRKKRH